MEFITGYLVGYHATEIKEVEVFPLGVVKENDYASYSTKKWLVKGEKCNYLSGSVFETKEAADAELAKQIAAKILYLKIEVEKNQKEIEKLS